MSTRYLDELHSDSAIGWGALTYWCQFGGCISVFIWFCVSHGNLRIVKFFWPLLFCDNVLSILSPHETYSAIIIAAIRAASQTIEFTQNPTPLLRGQTCYATRFASIWGENPSNFDIFHSHHRWKHQKNVYIWYILCALFAFKSHNFAAHGTDARRIVCCVFHGKNCWFPLCSAVGMTFCLVKTMNHIQIHMNMIQLCYSYAYGIDQLCIVYLNNT